MNQAAEASFGHRPRPLIDAVSTVPSSMDHDRRDAGEIHQFALQHAERDARRDTGVDGVAAGLQNLECGCAAR